MISHWKPNHIFESKNPYHMLAGWVETPPSHHYNLGGMYFYN